MFARSSSEIFMDFLLKTYSILINFWLALIRGGPDNGPVGNMERTDRMPSGKSLNSLRRRILSPLLCTVCASIGIFGGIASLFGGLVCVIIHTAISGDRSFDQAGTVLMIAAIPAILIGSIFLDEINGESAAT